MTEERDYGVSGSRWLIYKLLVKVLVKCDTITGASFLLCCESRLGLKELTLTL